MKAQELFDNNSLNDVQLHFLARKWALDEHVVSLEGVEYVHYRFGDGSKLIVGNNGYIGMEEY